MPGGTRWATGWRTAACSTTPQLRHSWACLRRCVSLPSSSGCGSVARLGHATPVLAASPAPQHRPPFLPSAVLRLPIPVGQGSNVAPDACPGRSVSCECGRSGCTCIQDGQDVSCSPIHSAACLPACPPARMFRLLPPHVPSSRMRRGWAPPPLPPTSPSLAPSPEPKRRTGIVTGAAAAAAVNSRGVCHALLPTACLQASSCPTTGWKRPIRGLTPRCWRHAGRTPGTRATACWQSCWPTCWHRL